MEDVVILLGSRGKIFASAKKKTISEEDGQNVSCYAIESLHVN